MYGKVKYLSMWEFQTQFYLLGSHFVVSSSIDGVFECLGCFAWLIPSQVVLVDESMWDIVILF
jgi:hypothetical protein